MKSKIQHVRQRDVSGCGIACVAMLTGHDYATVRSAWVGYSSRREFQLISVGSGAGMTRGHLDALIWRMGGLRVKARIEWVQRFFRGKPFGGHWIVKAGNALYDPSSIP
jgi:hypothetical protein